MNELFGTDTIFDPEDFLKLFCRLGMDLAFTALVVYVVYYRLYFNATALRLLIDIVRPYLWLVPRDMRYKLHMDYRPTKLSTSAEYIKRYNIQKA